MGDWYEAASKEHEAFTRQVETIRADRRLSPDGKQAAIASAWLKSHRAVTELRDRDRETKADERRRREQRLFGVDAKDPAAVITFRDGLDRAEATQNAEQASALLARAMRSGDAALARGVLQVALDRNWFQVAGEWSAENRSWADDVRAMVEERSVGGTAQRHCAVRFDARRGPPAGRVGQAQRHPTRGAHDDA